jgi:hypothetical protein
MILKLKKNKINLQYFNSIYIIYQTVVHYDHKIKIIQLYY